MPKQNPKTGKSSKTARVLNLLTDPELVEESGDQAAGKAETPATAPKLADERRTQAKIRGALEMELAGEAPVRPVKAAQSAPVPAAAAPEPRPAAPAAAPEPEPAPVFSVPTPQEPLQAAFAELRSAGERAPDDYICYNVTQALVEDKADKYIKMFGLCTCPRCHIDVIALALSNLPAKYVVAKPHELIPRLSIYEAKYNAAVVTQVMSACKKVLDKPHHERERH